MSRIFKEDDTEIPAIVKQYKKRVVFAYALIMSQKEETDGRLPH